MSDDGLRVNYFELGRPSPADAQLRQAVAEGVVPKGCLLGGHLVLSANFAGRDPCSTCDGPREKCGGRAREGAVEDRYAGLVERPTNTSPEVRAGHRRVIRAGLDRLAAEAEESKG